MNLVTKNRIVPFSWRASDLSTRPFEAWALAGCASQGIRPSQLRIMAGSFGTYRAANAPAKAYAPVGFASWDCAVT
jgi:hypothetical protein